MQYKRNRTCDSPKNSTKKNSTKQLKQANLNPYWLSKTVLTTNRFSFPDEEGKQNNNYITKERTIKPPPILVDKVNNIQPFITLLNENINGNNEIKVLSSKKDKIQPKSAEAYLKRSKTIGIFFIY